ncbi:MAG: SDR family NAD(P)-dependent oxidoreductase [Gemmatimonadetes bacterium]|nr:SDR family NAD(P)-dependent oxidoreductase [Gemmatimonadota bacterium]
MKTVLITGAGGFIGSHLAERCIEQGYSVRALVRYNSRNSWGWLDQSSSLSDIDVRVGDVRDPDACASAIEGVDTVYHLAALISIPYSYAAPLSYLRTNVEGTHNILQAARSHDVGSVVVTSTSEVYGTAQYVPIDEKHPLNAQSPYAASKTGADQLALSYHLSFGMPVHIARPFNVYGPRQSSRAIIPTVITQILAGNRELRLGNLTPTRDLTFVSDTVAGFIAVSESKDLVGQVTQIGSNAEISVGDLVALIADIMGVEVEVSLDEARERPAGSEVERLMCDNAKLIGATSWRPQYSLRTGLAATIEWLSANRQVYKSTIYNL